MNINDQHVAWVISNYYRCNKLYDTLLTFALEANIALYEESVGEEILYLQRLVLEGRYV